jgi:UDP-glucose 4-epimerase
VRRAFVTGGAGFIGSHLARKLLAEGWEVSIADNLSTGFKENVPKGSDFILLDLSKDGFIESLPRGPFDAIFHLAAQSSGEISFDNPAYDLKTNCLSTAMLLDWALKNGTKRFIFTSSMSIYGDQECQPVKESASSNPKSFYGIGKLASEAYARIYSTMGLNTTCLRLFNVYGPGQNMENLRQGMVSIYMAYILKKEPVMVKGSSERYRDFIYIDDVIRAYVSCLDNQNTFGKSYNVASGIKTTVASLLEEELRVFGHDPSKYPIEYKGITPGDTFGIVADIEALKRDTDWEPSVKLDEGLKRMRDWALDRRKD